jgi:hypothetical protein
VTVGVAEIPDNESYTERFTFQVRPNPFQSRALLYVGGFDGNDGIRVRFTVYSSAGQKIKTISEIAQGDRLVCEWDATDDAGRLVPAGVYFVRLLIDGQSPAKNAVERIVLVR